MDLTNLLTPALRIREFWLSETLLTSSSAFALRTSSQRILTKVGIARTCHPMTGESILKPCFYHDLLSPADKSAALCCCGFCCLHCLMYFIVGTTPFPRGSEPPTQYMFFGYTRVYNPSGILIS